MKRSEWSSPRCGRWAVIKSSFIRYQSLSFFFAVVFAVSIGAQDQTAKEPSNKPAAQIIEANQYAKFTNDQLREKLDDISNMEPSERRQLLVEIQKRIVEVGHEPFIQQQDSQQPKLEEVMIIPVSSNSTEVIPRPAVDKSTNQKTKKTRVSPPFGTTYTR